MTLPRLSANGWLLLIAAVLLVGLTGEPAYRAITGTKSAGEIRHEKEVATAMKRAMGPRVGDLAPPLELKAYNDGHLVKLSDFRGHRVLLSFYCGCYLCRGVATQFEKLQKSRPRHRPVMLGVCSFDADHLEPFLKDTSARHAVYLHDPGKRVGAMWGSTVCPRSWVIDEQGKIAFRHEEQEGSMQPSPVPTQVWNLLDQSKLLRTAAR
jgi:peroxiredoxin